MMATPSPRNRRQRHERHAAQLMPTPVPTQARPNVTKSRVDAVASACAENDVDRQFSQNRLLTPAPILVKPTPTPVPPPDVKAYLDRQVASAKDQKFHMTINGKDLPMTPFHVWRQKETGPGTTSTCIDMRGDDGRVYDIDFMTTGAQVSGIRIHKINGEALR